MNPKTPNPELNTPKRDFYVEIECYPNADTPYIKRDVVLVTGMKDPASAYSFVRSQYEACSGNKLKRILGSREAGPFVPEP